MKIQKININKDQKVLLFDLVPTRKTKNDSGKIIIKMVYVIGKRAAF